MTTDRIDRDTLIDAPLERVWSLVSVPGFWVAEQASVAGTVAEEGASLVANNANLGEVSVRVEKVVPPTYVAYRWASAFPGQAPRADNSTLVEFTLSPEGTKTRPHVVESGFARLNLPDDQRERTVRFNGDGWPQVVDAVKSRAEQAE